MDGDAPLCVCNSDVHGTRSKLWASTQHPPWPCPAAVPPPSPKFAIFNFTHSKLLLRITLEMVELLHKERHITMVGLLSEQPNGGIFKHIYACNTIRVAAVAAQNKERCMTVPRPTCNTPLRYTKAPRPLPEISHPTSSFLIPPHMVETKTMRANLAE